MTDKNINNERRKFIKLMAIGAGVTATGIGALTPYRAEAVSTSARIVIVGAGAAGVSIANRLARETKGASITIIDRRELHTYQPGLTLVATGIWKPTKVVDSNAHYIPKSVSWIKETVTEFAPETNQVVTDTGQRVAYDYLMVATGLHLDFDAIEGMHAGLIGEHGIACVYDTPVNATRSWNAISRFTDEGGVGIFTRPPGAIKCAGAPLKIAMLTEHQLREKGNRERAQLSYTAPATGLFSQPDINTFLKEHLPERGFDVNWNTRLTAIDAPAKRATFQTAEGEAQISYDFIHVVPPMRAPDALKNSMLASQSGPFAQAGWLEVNKHSLQHIRFSNVFGAGDCVGTPIGKTAASVKAQVPVAVHNLLQVIQGKAADAAYNGYTSCPLVTEKGEAMLVEFDYDLQMVPSFGFINPLERHWVPWVMKDYMLQGAYNAMLRGRV